MTTSYQLAVPFVDVQSSATKPTTRSGGGALVAGDRWLNTADRLWFYWDGTYWLSEALLPCQGYVASFGSNNAIGVSGIPSGYNVYFVSVRVSGSFASPQDASNFWTFNLRRANSAGSGSNVSASNVTSASLNIAAGSVSTTLQFSSVNTHVDLSSTGAVAFNVSYGKTNAAGNISSFLAEVFYRLAAI